MAKYGIDTTGKKPLDLAEWSYFWLGAQHTTLARGTVQSGAQSYVEYWVPSQVRHPYAIVMIHGGGGQGTDWMGRPDGERGWATMFIEEGYRVYVVDRPGHGRSPFHPELHGAFPQGAGTYEQVARQFTAPEKAEKPYGPEAAGHTQWPGTGVLGDPTVDEVAPGQGGSFLPNLEATHDIWRLRLAELFDRIGPAFMMTHSMGGPNAWIAGDVRPNLVKGMIGIEPAGPPMGNLKYGTAATKLTYDPPVNDASDLKTVEITPTEPNQSKYFIQAEPARKLKNLLNIPAVVVTSEASYHWPYDAGTVAFLRQAGVKVDHIKLPEIGIKGNAHFMMMEKNNREVLQQVLNWMAKVETSGKDKPTQPKPGETALKLADTGYFWTGVEHKKMPYGTICTGQMFVQYLIPQQVTKPFPIVLVHGGGAQMLHYVGQGAFPTPQGHIGQAEAGWAHYFAQAGYKVYLVDRPGHGRAPYHPDALGPIGTLPLMEQISDLVKKGTTGSIKRWQGTGMPGDPRLDQLFAQQNAAPQDNLGTQRMWMKAGAELIDKIGPAIFLTHSAGGAFGLLVANERPDKVKGAVIVEGAMPPAELAQMDKYKGFPIACVTAENSGMTNGPAAVDRLKQAGCNAVDVQLKAKGIMGNSHFMMLESNRKQVFDVIEQWISANVKA
jgi:pimeloyl-ACP methyl ester carboxylesterase